jgi:ComF family protein
VIIPVPVHPLKKRQRGFNQAELVAKELGKLLQTPVITDYLVRKEKTIPQKELTRQQRKANLREAFAARKKGVSYSRVLLIDDIYTTGATMDALSEILKENQSKNVFFLTICVGRTD